MLASLGDQPFDDPEWIFEIKWDGYRAIAEIREELKLYSRNGISFVKKFAPITEALKEQQHEMVLDGEIVAYNDDNLPDFQTLQHFGEHPGVPLVYHVFDLLYLNGHATTSLSNIQRKDLLKEALIENDFIKYCDHVKQKGVDFFEAAKENNLEGIIAKRADSTYNEGRRTAEWLKIKHHNTEEVIIAGFTEPRGSRKKFGALILGRYKNDKLLYAGHTGTGFNAATLNDMYQKLKPLIRKTCPFAIKPKTNMPATWVQPKLVANIKYSELTEEHIFRHPVFMGLRVDKAPEEVIIPKNEKVMTKAKNTAQGDLKSAVVKTSGKNNTIKEKDTRIKVGKQEVNLTNQSKIYWPDEGYTKGDLIAYYDHMSTFILPYLKDRPESLEPLSQWD
ncbi:non-homologous end-joining DNA ligase [Niabella yanshanensis]|uniref:DNA ligase (ATP) n=1 Tax=Niabella yanshanensis TaxID=577386 RepID=A0ABZ0W5F3_9BACT|nr:non-homologous end-joining DNA ligase [Niabella yanshanensis]WQD37350.1 non-homologous end-joining DNA ligase [Niabella yanshanensis]